MNNLRNSVSLQGRIGQAPELVKFESGSVKTSFSLAVNEGYRDKKGEWQDKTSWHNITCWGPKAEKIVNDCSKGAELFLEGKLTYNKYKTKDGEDRETTIVEVRDFFQIASSKKITEAITA